MLRAVWEALRWTWHDPEGYNVFSGPLPDLTLLGGIVAVLKHKNCHVKGCYRLARHQVGPYRCCSRHHPDVPDEISPEHIHQAHKENQ